MASASKYFYKAVATMTCTDLVHHRHSCTEAAVWNFTQTLGACCRYVLPIAILPMALKIRRLNRSVLLESATMFVEYSLASWIMGAGGMTMMCVVYRLLGRFTQFSVLALPVVCSAGLCSLLVSQKLVEMFAHGLLTICIQVSIARGDAYALRFVRDSRAWRTVAFMLVNAVLMQALRESSGPNLWILQPARKRREEAVAEKAELLVDRDENDNEMRPTKVWSECCGKATTDCRKHIVEDVFKYMKLGLGVELLKQLVANIDHLRTDPIQTIVSLPRGIDCDLPAFLITYCGLYRCLNCWLVRRQPHRPHIGRLIAAFAAGITFALCPNTPVLAHATATAIELTWSNYIRHTANSGDRPALINWLNRWPIARIFYPLAFAYLAHVRIFQPWLAPAVLRNLMSQTTNYKDQHIMTKYHERLFGGVRSDPVTLYLFGLDR